MSNLFSLAAAVCRAGENGASRDPGNSAPRWSHRVLRQHQSIAMDQLVGGLRDQPVVMFPVTRLERSHRTHDDARVQCIRDSIRRREARDVFLHQRDRVGHSG